MANEIRHREILAQIKASLDLVIELRSRLAGLILEARAEGVTVDRLAEQTGLSKAWIKQVSKTGKWPVRGKRPPPTSSAA